MTLEALAKIVNLLDAGLNTGTDASKYRNRYGVVLPPDSENDLIQLLGNARGKTINGTITQVEKITEFSKAQDGAHLGFYADVVIGFWHSYDIKEFNIEGGSFKRFNDSVELIRAVLDRSDGVTGYATAAGKAMHIGSIDSIDFPNNGMELVAGIPLHAAYFHLQISQSL